MPNYPIILSQGKFIHKDALLFPMEERGLQFGDGVYEVIRIYKGKPYLLDEHIKRLYQSLAAIKIKINQSIEEMKQQLQALIRKNKIQTDATIYMQITRGTARRNHLFPKNTSANIYAYIYDQARNHEILENGVSVITLPDQRWDNCYIKSLNLLPNLLAKQTAAEANAYEAILHRNNLVTECSSANVYLVHHGKIFTHPATKRILHGCVRMAVQRFTRALGIPLIEEAFTIEDIGEADEMFLTSSSSEVLAITKVDDQEIADGKPGPITAKLLEAYEIDAGIRNKIFS